MNTYEIIMHSRSLAGQGEAGFDDDAGYDGWHAELAVLGATAAEKALARRYAEGSLRESAAKLKALAAAITDRAKRLDAEADRVDAGTLDLLRATMEATGNPKLTLADGGTVKLATRTSRAVVIDDDTAIPAEFSRVKIEPDKVRIKSAIDSGRDVPGAHIEERTSESVSWSR